jgi:hypothetical protein
MGVETTNNRISYSGNGVTTAFSFPYKFLASADLVVISRDNTTGVETTKTLTTHYTVTGAGEDAGGTVTMLTAPASGTSLIIYNDPGITQGVDLRENDSSPAETQETALDRLTLISQRLKSRLDRSVRLSDGFSPSFDPTLPVDLDAAGSKVPLVNAGGTGWAVGGSWPTADNINNAQTYANSASSSASAASSSAAAAAVSAAAALVSQTSAASSATAASASQTSAASSATSASASQTSAASSATAASASQTSAASSATAASASQTSAASSATAASASQTSAASSATSASASATSAASSATSASVDAAAVLFRWGGTSGGAADVQTLTPSPALGAYAAGIRYAFLAGFTNTGAATINISGLGAKDLKTTSGAALSAGNITSGNLYTITYDGTNFRVHELVAVAAGSITNLELNASAITGQSEDTTPDVAADYLLTYDASAAALKKTLIGSIVDGVSSTKTSANNGGTVSYSDSLVLVNTATAFSLTTFATSNGIKPQKYKKISMDMNALTLNRQGSDVFRDRATNSLTSLTLKYPNEEFTIIKTATNQFDVVDRKFDQPQFGFGMQSTIASGTAVGAADLHAFRWNCPRDMLATEIRQLLPTRTAGQKIVVGIYADNSNTPVGGALLAQSSEYTTVATDNDFYTFQFLVPVKLTKGTRYWLAYHCDSVGNAENAMNIAAGLGQKYKNTAYSSTMPSTFPGAVSDAGAIFVMGVWGV